LFFRSAFPFFTLSNTWKTTFCPPYSPFSILPWGPKTLPFPFFYGCYRFFGRIFREVLSFNFFAFSPPFLFVFVFVANRLSPYAKMGWGPLAPSPPRVNQGGKPVPLFLLEAARAFPQTYASPFGYLFGDRYLFSGLGWRPHFGPGTPPPPLRGHFFYLGPGSCSIFSRHVPQTLPSPTNWTPIDIVN